MLTVSTSTFVKFLNKTSPQKVQELNKLLADDGFPYYKPLKDAVHAIITSSDTLQGRIAIIQKSTDNLRRQYNIQALKAFGSWAKKAKPESYFLAHQGAVTTPAQQMTVKLTPDFGVVLNGKRHIVTNWFSVDTSPSKAAVKQANRLVSKHLCVGAFSDCTACVLDLRKKELLDITGDPLAMDLLLASDYAWIDMYLRSKDAATPPAAAVA